MKTYKIVIGQYQPPHNTVKTTIQVSNDVLDVIKKSWMYYLPHIEWVGGSDCATYPLQNALIENAQAEMRMWKPYIPFGTERLEIFNFEDLQLNQYKALKPMVKLCTSLKEVHLIGHLQANLTGFMDNIKLQSLTNSFYLSLNQVAGSVKVKVPACYKKRGEVFYMEDLSIERAAPLQLHRLKEKVQSGSKVGLGVIDNNTLIPLTPAHIFLLSCQTISRLYIRG